MTTTLIHASPARFEAFDVARAGHGQREDSAERGVIWLAEADADRDLDIFGAERAICEVSGEMETVRYTDHAEDGDPLYMPDVMADLLRSTDAPVVRITRCQLIEHGQPRTIVAVRDPSLVRIVEWLD